MKMFDVTASRSHGWWAIHANVPGASVWTQARRLDQVEATAREAISLALDNYSSPLIQAYPVQGLITNASQHS